MRYYEWMLKKTREAHAQGDEPVTQKYHVVGRTNAHEYRIGETVWRVHSAPIKGVWELFTNGEVEQWLNAKDVEAIVTLGEQGTEEVNSHYNTGEIEAIDYMYDNMPYDAFVGYLEGNLKKYLHRWRYKKKPVEDLRKARDYLDCLVKVMEGNKPEFREWK